MYGRRQYQSACIAENWRSGASADDGYNSRGEHMRQRRVLTLNQAGDTIVEVLLAIAVVSVVLGGAFVSASHSLRGSQLTQERTEALKWVEGQVESLKFVLEDDPVKAAQIFSLPVGGGTAFCLDDALNVVTDTTDPRCLKNGRYYTFITPMLAFGTGRQFLIAAGWEKLGGGAPENLSLTYRAYP